MLSLRRGCFLRSLTVAHSYGMMALLLTYSKNNASQEVCMSKATRISLWRIHPMTLSTNHSPKALPLSITFRLFLPLNTSQWALHCPRYIDSNYLAPARAVDWRIFSRSWKTDKWYHSGCMYKMAETVMVGVVPSVADKLKSVDPYGFRCPVWCYCYQTGNLLEEGW